MPLNKREDCVRGFHDAFPRCSADMPPRPLRVLGPRSAELLRLRGLPVCALRHGSALGVAPSAPLGWNSSCVRFRTSWLTWV